MSEHKISDSLSFGKKCSQNGLKAVSGLLIYTAFFQTSKSASLYLPTEQRSRLISNKSDCFEIELLIMNQSFHET